jgi:hypothetical protein
MSRCARTDSLELQVPVELAPALPVGKSDVHSCQTRAPERQVPRTTVLIPGASESGSDARALVVRPGVQWRAKFWYR